MLMGESFHLWNLFGVCICPYTSVVSKLGCLHMTAMQSDHCGLRRIY